jgi:hypothetical protein
MEISDSGVSINQQFTDVNPRLLDTRLRGPDNQPMVATAEGSFAERFDKLRATRSLQALSDAVYEKTGVRISPQAMQKWRRGGGIKPKHAATIADFFGVTPVYLLFGTGPVAARPLEEGVRSLPAESGQQALDFLQYQFQRSKELFTQDIFAEYMTMIDRLKADMRRRKSGQ